MVLVDIFGSLVNRCFHNMALTLGHEYWYVFGEDIRRAHAEDILSSAREARFHRFARADKRRGSERKLPSAKLTAELISVLGVAVTNGLRVGGIVDSLLVHPSLAELLADAAS